MMKLLWLALLVAILYYGYNAYLRYKPALSTLAEQAASKPSDDYSGSYESATRTIDIDQIDGITLKLSSTDFGGNAFLKGNTATYDDGSCRIVMAFDAGAMTAKDNGGCGSYGGFTDTYKKQ